MITYQDAVLLLTQLKEEGFDVDSKIKDTIKNRKITMDVLKFINDSRPLDAYNFYEKIRKSYNDGHSKLYYNIVSETEDPNEVLIALSSLSLQILLFNRSVSDSNMFLQHMRFAEIQKVMIKYYYDKDLIPAIKLIRLFKADLKVFEKFRLSDNK